ncbi:MAG: hypothetical protein V3R41_03790 [Gammaproteobacteria bacterium]
MKVIDPGHKYEVDKFGEDGKTSMSLACPPFMKRSGGAIQYEKEWQGTNTQEMIRVLIDRTQYLDGVLECDETKNSEYHLRMALYWYEVRAYRRKQEKVNRLDPAHNDSIRPNVHRTREQDIPFSEFEIENILTGRDGHLLVK